MFDFTGAAFDYDEMVSVLGNSNQLFERLNPILSTWGRQLVGIVPYATNGWRIQLSGAGMGEQESGEFQADLLAAGFTLVEGVDEDYAPATFNIKL
jgi:hypothetical protein